MFCRRAAASSTADAMIAYMPKGSTSSQSLREKYAELKSKGALSTVTSLELESALDAFDWNTNSLEKAIVSPEQSIRHQALWVAYVFRLRRAFPHLMHELTNNSISYEDRRRITDYIGNLRDPRSLKPLTNLLEANDSAEVRALAAEAITKTFFRSARMIVRNRLGIEKDPLALSAILQGIGMLSDSEAENQVILYLGHIDHCVRYWAVYALGEMGSRSSVSHLRELVSDDATCGQYGRISSEAVEALRNVAARNGLA